MTNQEYRETLEKMTRICAYIYYQNGNYAPHLAAISIVQLAKSVVGSRRVVVVDRENNHFTVHERFYNLAKRGCDLDQTDLRAVDAVRRDQHV